MRKTTGWIVATAFGVAFAHAIFAGLWISANRTELMPAVPGWELQRPDDGAKSVSADEKMTGIYPVGSHLPDKQAPGGFGPCDNYPFDLNGRDCGAEGELSLVAFPDETVAYFRNRGIALRVVNRTRSVVGFAATDSKLDIVREALDGDGDWRAVESTVLPICGNSMLRVFLKPDQYWQFPAREYAGATKTKLRFRLDRGGGQIVYSNVFEGEVNVAQFGLEQGARARQARGRE